MPLRKFLARSPLLARVTPFVMFVLLTAAQGKCGAASAYWFYFAKTLVGLWLIWEIHPLVAEMHWAFSWEAVVVGVGIFAVWVGIDRYYPHSNELFPNYIFPFFKKIGLGFLCSESKPVIPWNPNAQFGSGSALAWLFILTRILGSTFIVPPIEEIFYRSFLYRYIASQNFLSVPLNQFLPVPFLATAAVFGLSHNEWLAGIVCGAAYQWLVLRKNRLGDAMTAHAITNFLLGVWVVGRGAWNFW
jgi:membrane protease YdiL (CAAX protease family)